MTRLLILIVLFGTQAVAMAPPQRPPIVWNCESTVAFQKLSQVPVLRKAHKMNDASALIAQLSPADRADRHAQFNLALLALDASSNNQGLWRTTLDSLAQMADRMPDYSQLSPAQRACAETPRLYAIFNTLGVLYSHAGDRAKAEHYFLRGETNQTPLTKDSRTKLNYNLGVLYTQKLDFKKAAQFYTNAKSPEGAAQLKAIQGVQKYVAGPATAPKN
jgi:uncharacterized protein HemY